MERHDCKSCGIKEKCELYAGGVRIEKGKVLNRGIFEPFWEMIKGFDKAIDELFDGAEKERAKCPQCNGFFEPVEGMRYLQECPKCHIKGMILGPGMEFERALSEAFSNILKKPPIGNGIKVKIFKLKDVPKPKRKRTLILNGDELMFDKSEYEK